MYAQLISDSFAPCERKCWCPWQGFKVGNRDVRPPGTIDEKGELESHEWPCNQFFSPFSRLEAGRQKEDSQCHMAEDTTQDIGRDCGKMVEKPIPEKTQPLSPCPHVCKTSNWLMFRVWELRTTTSAKTLLLRVILAIEPGYESETYPREGSQLAW